MSVSSNVVIMTRQELQEVKDKEFQRGVERGKFEANHTNTRVARNCANWKDGTCGHCGVQWQDCQVHGDFACPHFTPR